MKNKFLHIFFMGSFVYAAAFAGGRYAGASMELGIGARPLSLAGSAAAMSGNGETFFYNPSSLGLLRKSVINLMYAPTFGSLNEPMASYHHAGIAVPIAAGGTVAFNWTRFSVDDIPLFPKLQGDSFTDRKNNIDVRPDGVALDYFQDVEDVYYFSFARMIRAVLPLGWLYPDLPLEIPLGINFKFIRQSLYKNKASGMGIDLGAMLRFSLKNLFDDRKLGMITFGVSATDISHTSIVWDTKQEDRIQRTVAFGTCYEQPLWQDRGQLSLFWTVRNKYSVSHLFSLELKFQAIAVRIGKNERGLTTVAGIQFWRVAADYAFVANDFDDLHRISCVIFL
jgi:hypothetical protein